MKSVYFDTNIFDHLHQKKHGITEQHLNIVRSLVKADRISILLSIHTVEEVQSALRTSITLAKAQFQLLLELADWQKVVRPSHLLLPDDIHCYALGSALTSPFIQGTDLSAIQSSLLYDSNPSEADLYELQADIEEAQQQKEEFKAGIEEGREKALAEIKGLDSQPLSFRDYWESNADSTIEYLVERAGVLGACRTRGLRGLLDIRSVRMFIGISLSYGYAQNFEGRTAKIGDSRDIQHAVVASAADIFVTHDQRFTKLLTRIPIDGFQVVELCDLLSILS